MQHSGHGKDIHQSLINLKTKMQKMKNENQVTRLLNAIGYDNRHPPQILDARLKYWQHKVGPYYGLTDPALSETLRIMLGRVRQWKWGAKGLLFGGDTGLGKSRSLAALLLKVILECPVDEVWKGYAGDESVRHEANAWLMAAGHPPDGFHYNQNPSINPLWVNHVAFCNEAEAASWHRELDCFISRYSNTKLLIIDDLGKGVCTEASQTALFGILENRLSQGLFTAVSTQYLGEDFATMFSPGMGAAILRRLRELTSQPQKKNNDE